jgi:hypothetical protein
VLGHTLGKLDQRMQIKLTWHTGLLQITSGLCQLPLLMDLNLVGYCRLGIFIDILSFWGFRNFNFATFLPSCLEEGTFFTDRVVAFVEMHKEDKFSTIY